MFATHPDLKVHATPLKVAPQGKYLSHAEACRLIVQVMSARAKQIVIDLARMEDATTSAFAQLVLLRRALLRDGRDLCLTGLQHRTARVFEVNRLRGVLPTA
jgi:anti-anti-sigma regulatory factor